jgi:hypothetical protein
MIQLAGELRLLVIMEQGEESSQPHDWEVKSSF